jgi:uncharacterized repeat protein (TIGR01451 family)
MSSDDLWIERFHSRGVCLHSQSKWIMRTLPPLHAAGSPAVDQPTVGIGDQVTYTATVANAGPDAAPNAQACLRLPAGMQFVDDGPPGAAMRQRPAVVTSRVGGEARRLQPSQEGRSSGGDLAGKQVGLSVAPQRATGEHAVIVISLS